MKKNLKKKAADYKKETYLTGGGSAPPDLTDSEQKLLTILNKKTIYGLKNMHDSDATDIAKKDDMNAKASEKVAESFVLIIFCKYLPTYFNMLV